MSVQSSFQGICKGGPWDGQWYHSASATVPLIQPALKGGNLFHAKIDELTVASIPLGRYEYDGYGGFQWVPA